MHFTSNGLHDFVHTPLPSLLHTLYYCLTSRMWTFDYHPLTILHIVYICIAEVAFEKLFDSQIHKCDAFLHVTLLAKKGKICVCLLVVIIISLTNE